MDKRGPPRRLAVPNIGLGRSQKQLFGSINRFFAARLALIAASVRLASFLFVSTFDTETGIVEAGHAPLASVHDPI